MSAERPHITQDHFLSGLPFFQMLLPHFTYRYSQDDNSANRKFGILIPEQGGQPKSVVNVHSLGFTMIVTNQPVNIEFKKCFSLDAVLTKTDLLAEKQFRYQGNFTHLDGRRLRFNRQLNQVKEEMTGDLWPLQAINDTTFKIFKKEYGNIEIYFKECQLT